jgi:hypothetical protein
MSARACDVRYGNMCGVIVMCEMCSVWAGMWCVGLGVYYIEINDLELIDK